MISAPQTPLGELTALPQTLAGFEGVLLLREGKGIGGKRREGEEKEERGKEGKERKGRGGRGRKGRGKVASCLFGGWTPLTGTRENGSLLTSFMAVPCCSVITDQYQRTSIDFILVTEKKMKDM